MSQSTADQIDDVRNWILARNPERESLDNSEDLVENRLVDSLSFVEFIFTIEQASGKEIPMDDLNLDDLRTLGSIEKAYFTDSRRS
ncbi:acyl carrier protein [Spinactinospora alkalitolerans]|uniref:Acyl carrier protein n=1 Tax=Spinactinospora alkalitolerans TaxID=687207 RepID=A0A852U347_9ACTN|nr:acyl carrier protein [Spinactinospora alkalitolerans]NYE50591.1 acyl carrier protein [Spinactinospora alkalitolerans]